MRWPWQQRAARTTEANVELQQAENDLAEARIERDDARRMAKWIREQAADRLEIQLRVTYHIGEGP